MIKKKNTNSDNCFCYNIQKCINLFTWATFTFIQGCFLYNQSCKSLKSLPRQQQSAGTQWVDKLPVCSKVTGLTNRFFIIAKTIFFSNTISAKAPSGAATARSCRLSAPRSVQDEKHPFTADGFFRLFYRRWLYKHQAREGSEGPGATTVFSL